MIFIVGLIKQSPTYFMTQKEFIEKANKIHNNKYDYSKVIYENGKSIIKIICPIHGEFEQIARTHLKGRGCSECGRETKRLKKIMSTEIFIERAKKIHGDKYDYSNVDMYNRNEKGKVCIICPSHGEFWITPNSHLSGVGCSKCSNNYNFTNDEFVNFLIKKYGNFFDYSKVNFHNVNEDVIIKCPIHGEFKRKPKFLTISKLTSCCPFCNKENLGNTRQENLRNIFFEKAKNLYGNKYDYSKVVFNGDKNVIIINNENGDTFYVNPYKFLNGYDYSQFIKQKEKLKEDFIKKAKAIHRE